MLAVNQITMVGLYPYPAGALKTITRLKFSVDVCNPHLMKRSRWPNMASSQSPFDHSIGRNCDLQLVVCSIFLAGRVAARDSALMNICSDDTCPVLWTLGAFLAPVRWCWPDPDT